MSDVALVTGGAGFIGSHLCERLLDSGYDVVCLDNLVTGQRSNIAHLEHLPTFTLVDHDITREYLPEVQPTVVFHLASPASPSAYLRLPLETLDVGSSGTKNALEIARQANARFVFTSTSEIYGNSRVTPQPEALREELSPIGPRSVYDAAKRYAEALVTAYRRSHGARTSIARIFNTYGPRLQPQDGRAISNFIRQALAAQPLTVYGDGSQTRSFCYVSDLVEGLVALERSGYADPVNIGNPDERSILEIAELVKSKTGSDSPIVFEPLPEDDPLRRCPDITRATQALGWRPIVSLEEGLDKTIEWFRSTEPVAPD